MPVQLASFSIPGTPASAMVGIVAEPPKTRGAGVGQRAYLLSSMKGATTAES
jgi:hypothetical protein